MGKDTVLRIIRSGSRDDGPSGLCRELITSLRRAEAQVNFHCILNALNDSMIEEDYDEEGRLTHLRLRYITLPPPELPIRRFPCVVSLRVSCVVPIMWMYSICSSMPALTSVCFGTGCFEEERYEWSEQGSMKLEPSPQVTDLKIEVNISKFLQMEDDSKKVVKNRVMAILDFSTTSFRGLTGVEFVLPIDIDLDRFLNSFKNIMECGHLSKEFQHGKTSFKASASENRRTHSKGKKFPGSQSRSGSNSTRPQASSAPKKEPTPSTSAGKAAPPSKKVKREASVESESEPDIIVLSDDDDEHGPSSTTADSGRATTSTLNGSGAVAGGRARSPSLLSDQNLIQ